MEGSAAFLRESVESENIVGMIMTAQYRTMTEMLPTATKIDYIDACGIDGMFFLFCMSCCLYYLYCCYSIYIAKSEI